MTPQAFKDIREGLNLSQDKLGNMLGLDRVQIWRKEKGESAISKCEALIMELLALGKIKL